MTRKIFNESISDAAENWDRMFGVFLCQENENIGFKKAFFKIYSDIFHIGYNIYNSRFIWG